MSVSSTTVTTTVRASAAAAMNHVAPVDLTTIFTGYGPLPAVSATARQTGPWSSAGQSRVVTFSDGSTVRESLTAYTPARSFSYRITELTGTLQLLARELRGEWQFESQDGNGTTISWRYDFVPRNALIAPLVHVLVRTLWRGYMRRALRLWKAQFEPSAM